jgi:hypothetical protein
MDRNSLDQIQDRLDSLERQNIQMKRVVRTGLIAVVAVILLGADGGSMHKESLALHDSNGFTRLLLEANEKSASIKVLDPDGKTRIFLGTDKVGKPSFTIQDTEGRIVRRFVD